MKFLPMADLESTSMPAGAKEVAIGQVVKISGGLTQQSDTEVCCGGSTPEKSNDFERAGYELQHYVHSFIGTEEGNIPLVETSLNHRDFWGTLYARLGVGREDYRVAPGLYGVGSPNEDSAVIVTANYKLTFDCLRRELVQHDCWLLVLDTCGVNVWCAAGKGTFSTEELISKIKSTSLGTLVKHRRVIVPQLGAPGVAAHEVKLKSGFRVVYGPVRASDLPAFLQKDMNATAEMREVTFKLHERFELIPVEFYLYGKQIRWVFPLLFLLSGVGPSIFSFAQALHRGLLCSVAVVCGGFLGAMIVPLLLPWIPGRAFSVKGALAGLLGGGLLMTFLSHQSVIDTLSLMCIITAISSYLAMNFTGATPFTSPSGVEKETKIALKLQAGVLLFGCLGWIISPFL